MRVRGWTWPATVSRSRRPAVSWQLEAAGTETPMLPGPAGDFYYLRFETIASPVVVPRSNLQDGDGRAHVILGTTTTSR